MTPHEHPATDAAHEGVTEYRSTITSFPDRAVLEPPPAHASWTTFVSHRAVRAIAVARASRVAWIATWGGVLSWNRTDEYIYRRYSSEHGIAGTPSCIAVADDDRPWVGLAEGGLCFFDADRWLPYEHLRSEPIVAITAASAGRLWVGTATEISLVTRGEAPIVVVRDDHRCTPPTALLDDRDGVLIGSRAGVFRASERAPVEQIGDASIGDCTALARLSDRTLVVGTTHGVVIAGRRITPEVGDGAVVEIAPARGGIWVLGHATLGRIENGRWRTIDVPPGVAAPRAIALAGATDDYVWVGTDNLLCGVRGVGDQRWDADVLPAHNEDVLSNIGSCVVGDEAGRTWIGTRGGMFLDEPGNPWSFDAHLGDVRSLASVSGVGGTSVWAIAWPGGVLRRGTSGHFWEAVPVPAGLPRFVVAGHDGQVYVVIGDALWRLTAQSIERVAPSIPSGARVVVQAPDLVWFAATDRGLYQYVDAAWSLVPDLGMVPVTSLANIWFALWAGVPGALWQRTEHGWRKMALEHLTTKWTDPVTALARSRDHTTLWLACGGKVARCSQETGTVVTAYDRFDSGVCGNAIVALAESGGSLWVVSRTGIARHTM
jgi:ligand-binding sensor domain-containing protein